MNLVETAARIAIRAHEGQTRKGDDFPYIVHPFMVAAKLMRYGFSNAVIAAALTHDVLEDTGVSEDELREALGDEVAGMVTTLSEDKSLSWEERKEKYIEAIRDASEEVKAISAADKIHNLESLFDAHARQGNVIWDSFTRNYEQQLWYTTEHLAMLKATWQHPLLDEYEVLAEQVSALQ